jgi:nucleotide-binding universal stress UspA family protein
VARATGAALKLMTAVMIPPSFGAPYAFAYDVDELLEDLRASAADALVRAASQLDVPVTTSVTEGPPSQALEQLSREVDLVIAGSRGWGAALRVLLGSATSHLIHHAACPVIVVPITVGRIGAQPVVSAPAAG